MENYNYKTHEELLAKILHLLKESLTEREKREIAGFIDVGEYGLALDTLIEIVIEEDKKISREALEYIYELAEVMELDKKVLEEQLASHITC